MQKNLVIVESPAKAKTIEKFLGEDYKVLSSYGHIRDLKKKEFSIDTADFTPEYEIPAEKVKLVNELKSQAQKAETVWLASDEDREGEAISWHLSEVLGLTPENTKRIVFHEITKPAILKAIETPRKIDLNLVNAQQARRVLDRIVGFKLSPILWKKVKPALSAGRVQSVAVRLIVEREREIQQFKSEESYKVTAIFYAGEDKNEIKAELNRRFKTEEEARMFLEYCKTAQFRIEDIATKPQKRTPAAPFTTSTLQQEAAHKLGFTVAQTMMVAQKLYESGKITYMRTDSVNLSALCLNACKEAIKEMTGERYVKIRQYHTKTKGAQEAHEAIRPTYMNQQEIEGTSQERRLYDLIWKRTIASQMADAELEKTVATINISGQDAVFVSTGEVIKFDGFLKVYHETFDDEPDTDNESDAGRLLPPMSVGQQLTGKEIQAIQRFTQHPPRYNEASLVKKLEELGIGRPSTYAPTISTIQQREYVTKADKPGEEKEMQTLVLKGNKLTTKTKKTVVGAERGKLIPTDIGTVVNDFLLQYFPEIMDYNFTAEVEKKFDDVAEGKTMWKNVMQDFYKDFEPMVEKTLKEKTGHKVGERILGTDPASGKTVSVKIGRFGPVVQVGTVEDEEKPKFAQIRKDQSIETITLEEALELFKLPRTIGTFEGDNVVIGTGRFGPYVLNNKQYVSIPSDLDPLTISLEEATRLILNKRQEQEERHLKSFTETPDLEVLNGRYGPYISYKGKNYRLPKGYAEKARELTYEECMAVITEEKDKPAKTTRKRNYSAKK